MRLQDIAVGRKDLYLIDPRRIEEREGFNVRIDTLELSEHVRMLAESIRQVGVQTPLTVVTEGEQIFLVDGHCRLKAVQRLLAEGVEIKAVPVRTEEKGASVADRALSLITRNSGKPLSMIELAEVVKRLDGYGWSRKQIAEKAGWSTTQVDNMLLLSSATPTVQAMVASGQVSATVVINAVREHGPDKAADVLAEAANKVALEGKTRPVRGKDVQAPKAPRKRAGVDWNVVGPRAVEILRGTVDHLRIGNQKSYADVIEKFINQIDELEK